MGSEMCIRDSGTTDLFAAFNIADGTVISQLRRHHRAAEFKTFLARIDKAVPAGLEVHLVCDNLATHKAPVIQAWLGRHPRFRLHFTPTGSSWINQVERWFGFLTDQMIRRGVHKSVQALEADIRAWIENWNANPQPFAWTKTAGPGQPEPPGRPSPASASGAAAAAPRPRGAAPAVQRPSTPPSAPAAPSTRPDGRT